MAESATDQTMTQSWTQYIRTVRPLQFLASKFKLAFGFGGQSSEERELVKQRDELQRRVESLLADKDEFASNIEGVRRHLQDEHDKRLEETREAYTTQIDRLKAELEASRTTAKEAEAESQSKLDGLKTRISILDEDNKRLHELRDQDAQAHHERIESIQAQLNNGEADLETAQTRLREMETLTRDKDVAHQTQLQSLGEQLKEARDSLHSVEATAKYKSSSHRAEIDAKAQEVVDLQARLSEKQLQLNSKDDLLRSTLRDLKARAADTDDERVLSIIAAIESGLPQLIYPLIANKQLRNPLRKSFEDTMQQMKAAKQSLLEESNEQEPEEKALDKQVSNKNLVSDQSAADDDADDRIFEYILSSMKVALPQSVDGHTTEVFFEPVEYLLPNDNSEQRSHEKERGKQHQKQPPTQPREPDPRVPPTAKEKEIQQFYDKWPRKIYSNLALKKDSIRLVDILAGSGEAPIKVRVEVYEMEEVYRKYEALSYVCGKQDSGYGIILNGENVEVYPNLHNALKWLRRPTSTRRIWIDAICINQRSKNEKSKEIQNMGPIYNQAKTVNIFFGAPLPSEADYIGACMRFLNRLDSIAVDQPGDKRYGALEDILNTSEFNIQEVRQGFIKFCLQPWWRRIWTMVSAFRFYRFLSLRCRALVRSPSLVRHHRRQQTLC